MAQVTSPIILDSTGQQIHSDLQQIKNVLTTPSAAEDITFDNTGTGMQADDVQDAITELKSNLTQLQAGQVHYAEETLNTDQYAQFSISETDKIVISVMIMNVKNSFVAKLNTAHGYRAYKVVESTGTNEQVTYIKSTSINIRYAYIDKPTT